MAVPTFTSVSPDSGTAGGRNLVTIIGTNFRVPSDPEESVVVEFNGIEALNVDVLSTTELLVMVPPYRGEFTDADQNPIDKIAIKIYNIDSDGNAISGEEVTSNSIYRYKRAPIRAPRATRANQTYRQLIYETIWTMQRQVVPNVAIGTNVDFGEAGTAVIKEAKLPAITLIGPRLEEDFENRHRWEEERVDENGNKYWPAWTSIFEFDGVLASNNRAEMYGMIQGLIAMFMRTPYLKIPIDTSAPNDGYYEYPFVLVTPPNTTMQEADSNLLVSSFVFQIRRVPFELDEPVEALQDILAGEINTYGELTAIGDFDTAEFATED